MVNKFLSLSPKRYDDDYYHQSEVREKGRTCESSDEETTSSSLLPIPDTLDEMRKELKTTINKICEPSDFESSPKPKEYNLSRELDAKRQTEREVAIADKITSANLLLDDLLSSSNLLPSDIKKETPMVFTAKVARQRPKAPASETSVSVSDPSTESSSNSSRDCYRGVPVTPFIFPAPVCECARCPCERKDAVEPPVPVTEQPVKLYPEDVAHEPRKPKKRSFLSDKVRFMRQRYVTREKGRLIDEGQQTQTEYLPNRNSFDGRQGIPQVSCPCHHQSVPLGMNYLPPNQPFPSCGCPHQSEKRLCSCPADQPSSSSTPELECNCAMNKSISGNHAEGDLNDGTASNVDKTRTTKEGSRDHVQFREVQDEEQGAPLEDKVSREQNESMKEHRGMPWGPPGHPIKIPMTPIPVRSSKGRERIDIYYFDHGNSAYYRTTDSHPAKFTEYIIERTDEYATKFWAEVFGTVTIAIAFVISFVLQLYRWLFTAIIRALTVGLVQIFSDYFFKPLLTVIFNGLIQPCLILGYNIATSTRDFCIPVCEICELCAKDLAIIFGSCRIVEINQRGCPSTSCHCSHV